VRVINTIPIDTFIKRTAKTEILLMGILVDAEDGTTVVPANCPAKGREDNYGKDDKDRPACVYKNTVCPYFEQSMFALNDFTKRIFCTFEK